MNLQQMFTEERQVIFYLWEAVRSCHV